MSICVCLVCGCVCVYVCVRDYEHKSADIYGGQRGWISLELEHR